MYVVGPPAPATDDVDAPRLILRDGSVADVKAAGPADRDAVRRFFHDLSPESRRRRFLSWGPPSDTILDHFSEAADPARALTLLAWRQIGADRHIIAVASYAASAERGAEVSFAVDDQFHGRGLATSMLERLAAHASAAGFTRFEATTLADNAAMLDVFRDSGFTVRSRSSTGCLDIELSLTPSADAARLAERREHLASVASLRPLLAPHAVVVIGASHTRANIGRRILQALAGTFVGPVYAVHPHASEIDGVPAVRNARDLPAGVDMAVVAIPPEQIPTVVDDCAAAGVKALVVVTSGFAEAGIEGRARQDELIAKTRSYGMRLLGPNGMGLLNLDPQVRLHASFSPVVPPAGHVAFSSQSGALGIAILDLASQRGVGLSAFVSVGNKADVSSNDLLEYWEDDPNTRVVLLYLESFGNPRRFTRIARRVSRSKPIVALKAGRTPAGSRAAEATRPRWPRPTPPPTRSFSSRASSAWTRSTRCSIWPPASMPSRCRAARASPSSPMRAAPASWPRTRAWPRGSRSSISQPRRRGACRRSCRPAPASATRSTWWPPPAARSTGRPSKRR